MQPLDVWLEILFATVARINVEFLAFLYQGKNFTKSEGTNPNKLLIKGNKFSVSKAVGQITSSI